MANVPWPPAAGKILAGTSTARSILRPFSHVTQARSLAETVWKLGKRGELNEAAEITRPERQSGRWLDRKWKLRGNYEGLDSFLSSLETMDWILALNFLSFQADLKFAMPARLMGPLTGIPFRSSMSQISIRDFFSMRACCIKLSRSVFPGDERRGLGVGIDSCSVSHARIALGPPWRFSKIVRTNSCQSTRSLSSGLSSNSGRSASSQASL